MMPRPPHGFKIPPQVQMCLKLARGAMDRGADVPSQAGVLTGEWIKHGTKTVYVDTSLIEACENTETLEDLSWRDIRHPYPCWSFFFQRPLAGNVSGATIWCGAELPGRCSLGAGSFIDPTFYQNAAISNARLFQIWRHDTTTFSGMMMDADELGGLTIGRQLRGEVKDLHDDTRQPERSPELALDDDLRLVAVCCNLMLIMQSYPAYVTSSWAPAVGGGRFPRRTQAMRVGLPTALRPPVVVNTTPSPTMTTHASPKTHWRRGHWRRQPHHEKWAALNPGVAVVHNNAGQPCHMVWLMPMLVGADQAKDGGRS